MFLITLMKMASWFDYSVSFVMLVSLYTALLDMCNRKNINNMKTGLFCTTNSFRTVPEYTVVFMMHNEVSALVGT